MSDEKEKEKDGEPGDGQSWKDEVSEESEVSDFATGDVKVRDNDDEDDEDS